MSADRLADVFGHLHEGVLVEDEQRRVRFANRAFTDIFMPGADPQILIGADCDAAAVASAPQFRESVEWLAETRSIVSRQRAVTDEWEMADGRWLQRDYRPRVLDERIVEHIWIYRDVTDFHARLAPVEAAARASEQSGLRQWSAAFEQLVVRVDAEQLNARGSVALVKIRHMDRINAELGYAGGDGLIFSVLADLRGVFGVTNVERVSGATIGILSASDDARDLAARLHAVLDPTRQVGDNFVVLRLVVGSVSSGAFEGHPTAGMMIESAHLALREGQERRVDVVMDGDLLNRVRLRQDLDARITDVLASGEFLMHYQPVVRLADLHVVGYESLVRWAHPDRGLIAAGDFIPAAEETGNIPAIDRWVVNEVCSEAASLLGAPEMSVAINLSPLSFDRGDEILETVREAIAACAVEPSRFVIEVTETAIAANHDDFVRLLWQIHELGVGISIDDFGVGSSTLGLLKDIPFDYLKLDKVFVNDVAEPRVQHLIRAAVAIAENFDAQVIAEGVETAEQADLLIANGVVFGQGWHLGMPQAMVRQAP